MTQVMNKIMRLTLKGVVAVALLSATTACNNTPLLGRNRAANQVQNSPQATQNQPVGQAPLGTSQPGQSNTTTTAQAPQTTVGQRGTGTGNTDPVQSDPGFATDGNEAIPALW